MPINHAPTGRMTNPTAKIAAVFRSCAVGSPLGKKACAKYSANAEYTYQSNHSTRLPAEPPRMFLRRLRGCDVVLSTGPVTRPMRRAVSVDGVKHEANDLRREEEQLSAVGQAVEQIQTAENA